MANLGYGSSGSDVRELQNALIAAGYDVGSTGADGIFGAKTQAAVKQYQQDNGLSVDGIAGVQTQGSLYFGNASQTQGQSQNIQPATYSGGWGDETYKTLLQQAINMNYDDWTKGEQYQSLASRYGEQGKMSMQDVLGQVASRTGGLASSYATTAAHQQYNEWMALLEEAARAMYADERDDLIENAILAKDYADYEYKRYIDNLQRIAASSSSSSFGGGGYSGGGGYDNGGLTSAQVKALQREINSYRPADQQIAVDGKWGSETSAAVGGATANQYYEAALPTIRDKNIQSSTSAYWTTR